MPELFLSTFPRGGMPVRTRLRASGFYENWLYDPKMPAICNRDPVNSDDMPTCKAWLKTRLEPWIENCRSNEWPEGTCERWAGEAEKYFDRYFLYGVI